MGAYDGVVVYLITFCCYGSHLHGERGAVDRWHNRYGGPSLEESAEHVVFKAERMVQLPYSMDERRRAVVLSALRERCLERGWLLLAGHVRTNHVHTIVEVSEEEPERGDD